MCDPRSDWANTFEHFICISREKQKFTDQENSVDAEVAGDEVDQLLGHHAQVGSLAALQTVYNVLSTGMRRFYIITSLEIIKLRVSWDLIRESGKGTNFKGNKIGQLIRKIVPLRGSSNLSLILDGPTVGRTKLTKEMALNLKFKCQHIDK